MIRSSGIRPVIEGAIHLVVRLVPQRQVLQLGGVAGGVLDSSANELYAVFLDADAAVVPVFALDFVGEEDSRCPGPSGCTSPIDSSRRL